MCSDGHFANVVDQGRESNPGSILLAVIRSESCMVLPGCVRRGKRDAAQATEVSLRRVCGSDQAETTGLSFRRSPDSMSNACTLAGRSCRA